MFEKRLEPNNRMDMYCFTVIVDFNGEVNFIYDNGVECHYFNLDAFTELARLFDNEEFCEFNEAHDECVDAFCAYGNEYARMIDAQDERFVTYLDMLDAFESSVEKREKHLVKRANAHAEWISSCIDFACTEDINIELICEIGARMMHVDKDLLWY